MSKVKDGCECSDNKERKHQVRQALYGAWYESDQDRDYAIDSFTKSTLTVQEIESLVAPLKEIAGSVKDRKFKVFGSNNTAMGGVA